MIRKGQCFVDENGQPWWFTGEKEMKKNGDWIVVNPYSQERRFDPDKFTAKPEFDIPEEYRS